MILVTGNAGFIGQHLYNELKKRKIEFVGYDIKGLHSKDIRNRYDLECAFEMNQITEVIHLAALAGVRRSKLYPEEYISTNITGTQNIVDMCNKYDVNHLIFYSSSSVYGNLDTTELPALEDTDKNPASLYGITKLAGEHIVNNAKCQTTIIRPFTVYGENGRKDEVVYKWLEQIKNKKPITVYGNGDSCRGYVYVKDLVKTTVDIVKDFDYKWTHEDYNIGGSEVVTLKDLLNIFLEEFGGSICTQQLERPDEDVFRQYANTTKAQKFLGFKPKSLFEKNIRKIIKEFKTEWQTKN